MSLQLLFFSFEDLSFSLNDLLLSFLTLLLNFFKFKNGFFYLNLNRLNGLIKFLHLLFSLMFISNSSLYSCYYLLQFFYLLSMSNFSLISLFFNNFEFFLLLFEYNFSLFLLCNNFHFQGFSLNQFFFNFKSNSFGRFYYSLSSLVSFSFCS